MTSDFKLHSIKFKRSMPLNEQHKHLMHIAGRIPKRKKITDDHIAYSIIPKTKFISRSYRTKTVSPDINLVFGKLKNKEEVGAGIFSPKLDGFNNTSSNTLLKYGAFKVTHAIVYRQPLHNALHSLLNVISFGKFNSKMKELGYDKLFHLSLKLTVVNGLRNDETKDIYIEKNEVVNIVTLDKASIRSEGLTTMDVEPASKTTARGITLYDMINKTRQAMGDTAFFDYNAWTINCQNFILNILKSNNMSNNKIEKFIFQDVQTILKDMPSFTEGLAKGITTAAAVVNKLTGQGSSDKIKVKRLKNIKGYKVYKVLIPL